MPDFIVEILIESGYDSSHTWEIIDNNEIDLIEKYANENLISKKEIFQGTVYENSTEFKFRPGHRALLKCLPKYVKDFKSKKNVHQRVNRSTNSLEAIQSGSQTNNQTNNQMENQTNDQTNNQTENQTVNQIEKISATNDEQEKNLLKNRLVKKLLNFAEKINLKINLDLNNINNFRKEGEQYKCRITCPICDKTTACSFLKYWLVGNVERHFKNHKQNEIQIEDPNQLNTEVLLENIELIEETIPITSNATITIQRIRTDSHIPDIYN